jgi:hypothetical protein
LHSGAYASQLYNVGPNGAQYRPSSRRRDASELSNQRAVKDSRNMPSVRLYWNGRLPRYDQLNWTALAIAVNGYRLQSLTLNPVENLADGRNVTLLRSGNQSPDQPIECRTFSVLQARDKLLSDYPRLFVIGLFGLLVSGLKCHVLNVLTI